MRLEGREERRPRVPDEEEKEEEACPPHVYFLGRRVLGAGTSPTMTHYNMLHRRPGILSKA